MYPTGEIRDIALRPINFTKKSYKMGDCGIALLEYAKLNGFKPGQNNTSLPFKKVVFETLANQHYHSGLEMWDMVTFKELRRDGAPINVHCFVKYDDGRVVDPMLGKAF